MALAVLPRERELMTTSSVDLVERREKEGSVVVVCSGVALLEINFSWSFASLMGQFRDLEPMTSTCFSNEPWSQYKRICEIFWFASNCTMWI